MTYPAWPSSIPDPETPVDIDFNGAVIGNDAGQRGQVTGRRLFTENIQETTIRLLLTTTEFQALETFYTTPLNCGNNYFTAPWLSIIGYNYHRAKIVGPISCRVAGHNFLDVNVPLEITHGVRLNEQGNPDPWVRN